MNKIKAIVVDDEVASRKLVSEMILELNDSYEIVGMANNITQGYDLIKKISPDVLFLDIRMPGGGGFELLAMLGQIDFEVVFISGFDSYALKAFEFNALDYVLKPIDSEKFKKTLKKVEQSIAKKLSRASEMKALVESYDLDKLIIAKIPIHSANTVYLVPIREILSITWEGGVSMIRAIGNQEYTSSKQLGDLEFILDQHPFMIRINRGTFINLNYLKSYSKGATCNVTLIDSSEFEVSRRKKGEILEILAKYRMKLK